ncbi:MAG TPA: RNA 2'-phosphotransferase [Candidatus Kapabacteria bacterium]|nr:RNA 2'-phosphotransferase [Candidatus Kapabacteria bacterium]
MDFTQLSKRIAYILRHAPWEYELELDEEGWTSLDLLIEGLRTERHLREITVEDLEVMQMNAAKQRFEIRGGRIRAYYGHSLPGRIVKRRAEPPPVLYHGTVDRFLPAIRADGLKPMGRQYVHLSRDTEMADTVARRRGNAIVILQVRAADAAQAGTAFYEEENGVWLAGAIAPEWIVVPR